MGQFWFLLVTRLGEKLEKGRVRKLRKGKRKEKKMFKNELRQRYIGWIRQIRH